MMASSMSLLLTSVLFMLTSLIVIADIHFNYTLGYIITALTF